MSTSFLTNAVIAVATGSWLSQAKPSLLRQQPGSLSATGSHPADTGRRRRGSECLVSVLWAIIGYSLAFGTDHDGLIGGLGHVMLRGGRGESTRTRSIHF